MSIGAIIFDFNGVLVDDESVHFALFSEILAQEGVALAEEDYHERYLGYDDRRCFEAVLLTRKSLLILNFLIASSPERRGDMSM